jgi:alpha-glucosidase
VLRRLRAIADEYPGTALLGEVSSQPGAYERVAGYTAGSELLHMAYTLRPLRGGFDLATLRDLLAASAAVGAPEAGGGWACWSFSNHDAERAASRWAPEGRPDPRFAKLLLGLLLSLRGSVCLYQGEELGLPEAELRPEELRDPFGLAYWPEFRGRDGSRTPMPWQATAWHAGFTGPGATPWLPVPPAHRALAVDAQEGDPESVLEFARALLDRRRRWPALRHGTLEPLDLPAPLLGFVRAWEGARVLCVFNLDAAEAALPEALAALVRADGAAPGRLEPYGLRWVPLPAEALVAAVAPVTAAAVPVA